MKNIYIIMAFHAHELLWDLPETLLSYLAQENPMKDSFLDENYLKKRKEEDRDIYTMCSKFGDRLQVPLCVEYTNELLVQIREVLPRVFNQLKADYQRGRLYPIYGHAHHTHVSLLRPEEMIQEIVWNKQYLHNYMQVPYPKYSGLFPSEASFSYEMMGAIEEANIDYVIFPHLEEDKAPFKLEGEGNYVYQPFLISGPRRNIIAFPRNFPISQEIWRPITKMKREDVKAQGYMLGDFAVFANEYLYGEREKFPISMAEGVEIYKQVLSRELENVPENGVLVYIQDLELMDFGDIALEIMEEAWQEILSGEKEKYRIHFVTPDQYIDEVLKPQGVGKLARLVFDRINWAPEIRLILRADGHYPPLGVTGVGRYDRQKTGLYDRPHIFWENGKYYCRIFDQLLDNFGIHVNVPVNVGLLGETSYNLLQESLDSQAVLYLRLMKRACNWGWRPTEGRQKLPCLKGYLLCAVLLKKLQEFPAATVLNRKTEKIEARNFVGISETLRVFIDSRLDYLKYALEEYAREKGGDLTAPYTHFKQVQKWKERALEKTKALYEVQKKEPHNVHLFLILLQEYSQAVFMATEYLQKIWATGPDSEYMVAKMYHYLYDLYPPLFPSMVEKIDSMGEQEIESYFRSSAMLML